MERIKNHQSAALDRMAALQKRYKDHQQEQKKSTGSGNHSDLSRRTSNASQCEDENVSINANLLASDLLLGIIRKVFADFYVF